MSHYGIFFVLVNEPVNSGKNINVATLPGGIVRDYAAGVLSMCECVHTERQDPCSRCPIRRLISCLPGAGAPA